MKTKTYSDSITNVIKDKLSSGGGCYGQYIRYCFYRGIKLLHTGFESIEAAMKSKKYEAAIKEMELLVETRKRVNFVPRCYGIKIVELEGSFRIGIIMQHLGNVTLAGYYRELKSREIEFNYDKIICQYENELKEVGIKHEDIHTNNIMRFKKKWWVIDFSPSGVFIIS